MIVVTENWSGRQASREKPWTARREFVVTGVTTELAALVAVDDADPTKRIPQRGEGHPQNTTRLKCQGPSIKEVKGPDYWVVTCPYGEGDYTDDEDDPLEEETKITWRTLTISEPMDMDLDRRPIYNSAGAAAGSVPLTVSIKELRLIKNFPFYDIGLSIDYENAVNSHPVDMSAIVSVAPQYMKCVTIEPAVQDFTPDAPYLPIAFTYHIMLSSFLGPYPWQHRIFDQGREGWYTSGGAKHSSRFNMNGEPTDIDIRLDGGGLPLTAPYPGTSIKVGDEAGAPVAPPNTVSTYAKKFYDRDGGELSSATSNCASVILIYKAARVVDFSPMIGLF